MCGFDELVALTVTHNRDHWGALVKLALNLLVELNVKSVTKKIDVEL